MALVMAFVMALSQRESATKVAMRWSVVFSIRTGRRRPDPGVARSRVGSRAVFRREDQRPLVAREDRVHFHDQIEGLVDRDASLVGQLMHL